MYQTIKGDIFMACDNNTRCSSSLCSTGNSACERTCIEVDKVFDVCKQQRSVPATLTVEFSDLPTGYTITSLINSAQGVMTNLIITPLDNNKRSRVRYTLNIPILITAINSVGGTITGTVTMVVNQDILLRMPKNALIAPEVKAVVSVIGSNSEIINSDTVVTEACTTIITKVVADVILVIPSYGYPKIRDCEMYSDEICPGIFNKTPVFPT